MEPAVRHDKERHAFVIEADGAEAVLSYAVIDDATVDFRSTYVPVELRGRNLGTRLVCAALDWAHESGARVVPSCWFVANVAGRINGYSHILARDGNG